MFKPWARCLNRGLKGNSFLLCTKCMKKVNVNRMGDKKGETFHFSFKLLFWEIYVSRSYNSPISFSINSKSKLFLPCNCFVIK